MDFKSDQFNTIVEQALMVATGNERWRKAIERAASGLRSGAIIVTELASGSMITTENGTYNVSGDCTCTAFKHGHRQCKHRAAKRLCALYSDALLAEECDAVQLGEKIETAIECDRSGVKYTVTRCGGWAI